MSSSDDGWIAGGANTLLRWDGTDWNPVEAPTSGTVRDISMVGPNDGWMVYYRGSMARWDGTSWRTTRIKGLGSPLYSVSALPGGIAWVSGYCNSVYRVEGDVARRIATDRTYPQCYATGVGQLVMVTDDFGWAIRTDPYYHRGRGQMLHWNGETWTPKHDRVCCCGAIDALDARTAVSKRLCNWNGTYWEFPRN